MKAVGPGGRKTALRLAGSFTRLRSMTKRDNVHWRESTMTADQNDLDEVGGGNSEGEAEPLTATGERSRREAEFARRALIRAGWAVPVVLGVGLPRQASASPLGGYAGRLHIDTPGLAVDPDPLCGTGGALPGMYCGPHIDIPHGDMGGTTGTDP
jgi:hypothetical protein